MRQRQIKTLRMPPRKVDSVAKASMQRSVVNRFSPLYIVAILAATLRLQCSFVSSLEAPGGVFSAQKVPISERFLRTADTLLMEPGYQRAKSAMRDWAEYVTTLSSEKNLLTEIEPLVNHPAIVGYVQNPHGPLAQTFEQELNRTLESFGNGALIAWRVRTFDGKTIISHNETELPVFRHTELKRKISPDAFSIPIEALGNNYTLDAKWNITRLSSFPLTRINSEFLFIQTTPDLEIVSREAKVRSNENRLFVSEGKYTGPLWGINNGARVLMADAQGLKLIVLYPFAGYLFYGIRGGLALFFVVVLIFSLFKLRSLMRGTKTALDERESRWIGAHYDQSLSLHQKALGLTDRSVSLVEEIKVRDASALKELGVKLTEITSSIEEETRILIREALAAQTKAELPPVSKEPTLQNKPLHKRSLDRPAIRIPATEGTQIQVSIEMDLKLESEKETPREKKAAYVTSLRRQASLKSREKEFIHDEELDNYDYTPEAPLPLPEKPTGKKGAPNVDDLEVLDKFRYESKPRVLPMDIYNK